MVPAATAEAIQQPSELDLPDRLEDVVATAFGDLADSDDIFAAFQRHLSESGRAQFNREIVHALVQAKKTNDLRPVQEVIDAWFRTWLFVADPGFTRALASLDYDEADISREEQREILRLS